VLYTQLSENEVELFRQEARTIARLDHPNIVQVLEFGMEDTTPLGHKYDDVADREATP
jgi:eukaryotic-like serine/threonine-protein kinase